MLSRAADNLYWMSRYLERAEHIARLVSVNLNLMLDSPGATNTPDMDNHRWRRLLASLRTPTHGDGDSDDTLAAIDDNVYAMIRVLAFDRTNANSMVSCIESARENARHVREQVSSEMWEYLNRLYLNVKYTTIDDVWNNRPQEFFRLVKEGSHLFQGITDGTMNHGEGWHFIQVGRYIERADATATLLKVYYNEFPSIWDEVVVGRDYVEWVGLLKSCTAFEAYCKVYSADLRPDRIAEFLLLNAQFPHAVCFSIDQMQSALNIIADTTETHKARRVNRLAGRLRAGLEYGQLDEIMVDGLSAYLDDIQRQCARIHAAIYEAYIEYPIEKELEI